MAEQDHVSFQRGDDTKLLVRSSGAWRLRGGLPSVSLVDRELRSAAQVRGVAFDAQELSSWDSSVLTLNSRNCAASAELIWTARACLPGCAGSWNWPRQCRKKRRAFSSN